MLELAHALHFCETCRWSRFFQSRARRGARPTSRDARSRWYASDALEGRGRAFWVSLNSFSDGSPAWEGLRFSFLRVPVASCGGIARSHRRVLVSLKSSPLRDTRRRLSKIN